MNDLERIDQALHARASGSCELCGSQADLGGFDVVPSASSDAERMVLVCETCLLQLEGRAAPDPKHWFCLKESVWSEVPAVQVVSYRLLKKLESEGWAQDLLGQLYLPDDVQAWADAGSEESADAGAEAPTLDSNGSDLRDGDAVTLIKDLDVKGAGFVAKRGTMVKNIRLTGDPENVEGRIQKMTLVLKTKFLKKA